MIDYKYIGQRIKEKMLKVSHVCDPLRPHTSSVLQMNIRERKGEKMNFIPMEYSIIVC